MANRVRASATSAAEPPVVEPLAGAPERRRPEVADLGHDTREAFRLAGTALAGVDAKGRILSANPAFERLVGLAADHLVDRPLSDLWAVTFFEDGGAPLELLEEGGAVHLHVEPALDAGSIPRCSLRVVQLTDRDGSRFRFGIQAERFDGDDRLELSAGAHGLRLSFDQLVVGMCTILMDGRLSAVNLAFCALVGRDADELERIDVFSLVHPDDRREDLARGMRVYAGENDGWTREKRLLRRDGSIVWVLETVTLVRDDAGEPLHFLCQSIDITDRKAAEERVRESEARFKFLAEGLPLGLMRTDPDGVVREANSALADLLGTDPLGSTATSLMLPEDVDRVALHFTDGAPGNDWQTEFRIPGRDGAPRWIRANGRTHGDDDGGHVATMSIWTDITDLKAAEDHLREQATTDSLTRLPNRAIFYDRLQHALALAARSKTRVAVLFVDLDKFKPVNDAWGHAAGDALLQLVGERLLECVRDGDTLARVGGDEFMVLAESIVAVDTARVIGERIIERMAEPFDLPYGQAQIGASVGLAVSGSRSTPQTLVRAADVAVYRAKANGGGRIVVT